jgi:hypothetical protein
MPTTLEIDRDELRDSLVKASYYLKKVKPETSGGRREIVYTYGLFDELVEQIDAEIEKEQRGGM